MNIKSIAEQAGVSLATVSRVINNSAPVSEETAGRVRSAASGLGYCLRPKPPSKTCFRTRNVALVYAGWNQMQLNEWGFVDGFEEVFSENDLRLMLVQMPETGALPRVLAQQDCDGIVILSELNSVSDAVVKALERVPCIHMVHETPLQPFGDEFFCDNRLIAKLATEHLLRVGVKHPAFFNIHPEHHACIERELYFKFFMEQANIKVTSLVASPMPSQTTPSHVLAQQVVEQMAKMRHCPDGLFVPVDYQLPELYSALKAQGIEPMKDVQIISCDNCERHLVKTDPRPVTIDLHWRDLACHAARQLIWRIEHPAGPPVRLVVKPEIIYPATTSI